VWIERKRTESEPGNVDPKVDPLIVPANRAGCCNPADRDARLSFTRLQRSSALTANPVEARAAWNPPQLSAPRTRMPAGAADLGPASAGAAIGVLVTIEGVLNFVVNAAPARAVVSKRVLVIYSDDRMPQ